MLSNIFLNFQRYIIKILAKKYNLFVITYLNNIFIYTKDPKQMHIKAIQWFFNIF